MMKPKSIIKELVLFLTIFLSAWLLAFWITGSPKLDYNFDINLNDTYLVLKGSIVIITFFLMLIAVIYLVRGLVFQFKQPINNIITVFVLLLLNIILSKLIKSVVHIEAHLSGGWTIYPPLSALPKVKPPTASSAPGRISQILSYFQFFFIIILVVVAILTGKNWEPKQ